MKTKQTVTFLIFFNTDKAPVVELKPSLIKLKKKRKRTKKTINNC